LYIHVFHVTMFQNEGLSYRSIEVWQLVKTKQWLWNSVSCVYKNEPTYFTKQKVNLLQPIL